MTSSSSEPPPLPPPVPRTAVPGFVQDLFATVLSVKGRTAEAVAQRRAALEKLEEILGPDHPELLQTLDLLAIDLLRQEDFAAAAPILQRIYQDRVNRIGPENPETLYRLSVLTECLMSAKSPAEAQPLLQHQLSLNERLKGPDHEDTLAVVRLLGRAYEEQGDLSTAEGLLRRAQEGCERTLGLGHFRTLASTCSLYAILSEGPEPAAAEPWGGKMITAFLQVNGPADPATVAAALDVAKFYGKRQNFTAGIAVLRQVLDAFPGNQGTLSVEQARLQSLLAALLDMTGQIDEAAPLSLSAAHALRTHLGQDHPDTDRAFRYTVDLSIRRSQRTPWGRFQLRCLRLLGKLLPSSRHVPSK